MVSLSRRSPPSAESRHPRCDGAPVSRRNLRARALALRGRRAGSRGSHFDAGDGGRPGTRARSRGGAACRVPRPGRLRGPFPRRAVGHLPALCPERRIRAGVAASAKRAAPGMKVAFQGVRGAYSEAALLRHFGASLEAVGFPFSEQVFDAVEDGRAGAGFVPVENSIAGPVGINTDLLLERRVFATAESYLSIDHCLLARQGARLEEVNTVYSHPIALAQCRDFISRRGLRAVPEYDTAGAAEIVAGRNVGGEAAIASKRCAEVYGLSVLAEDIQTVQNNITRFLAFRRQGDLGARPRGDKTSLAVSVHHHPGALLDCLQRFAD